MKAQTGVGLLKKTDELLNNTDMNFSFSNWSDKKVARCAKFQLAAGWPQRSFEIAVVSQFSRSRPCSLICTDSSRSHWQLACASWCSSLCTTRTKCFAGSCKHDVPLKLGALVSQKSLIVANVFFGPNFVVREIA